MGLGEASLPFADIRRMSPEEFVEVRVCVCARARVWACALACARV